MTLIYIWGHLYFWQQRGLKSLVECIAKKFWNGIKSIEVVSIMCLLINMLTYPSLHFTMSCEFILVKMRLLSKDDVLSKRLRQHIQPNIYSPAERNKTLRTSILGCFSNNTLKKNEQPNPFCNWGHLERIYPDGGMI